MRNDIYYNIPLESLLGSQLPLEFDGILLSNNAGQVLVQKEIESLNWDEKKTFLKMARAGTSVSNISWLLKMAKKQVASKIHLSEDLDIFGTEDTAKTKVNKDKKNDVNVPIDLGHSTFVDIDVAGKEYRIYIKPFVLNYKIYNEKVKEGKEFQHFSKFYVLGFVEKSKIGGLAFSLGFSIIAYAFLLLLTCFLAWPFLKLNFMGEKEAISSNSIRTLLLSLLFGLVILTIFLLTIFTYNGVEIRLDNKGEEIAEQIETGFLKDLKNIIDELYVFSNLNNFKDCQKLDMHRVSGKDAFSCLAKKSNDFSFPLIRDIYNLDNRGDQVGAIIYYVERLFSSKRLRLDFRDYFKKPRDGEAWHWQGCDFSQMLVEDDNEQQKKILDFKSGYASAPNKPHCIILIVNSKSADKWTIASFNDEGSFQEKLIDDSDSELLVELNKEPTKKNKIVELVTSKLGYTRLNDEADRPFYVERIHNFSDGHKASQVSIPINGSSTSSIASKEPGLPVVRASTSYFPEIAAPVLPASFNFAIIEDASGEIIYHSQDQKSFVENLYAESDFNHHLITHVQTRHEGEVEGLYHGQPTKFYISPLAHLPWSVVVYYDIGRLQSFMAKTAIVSLMLYIPYLLVVLITLSLIKLLLVKNWDWLWPHYQKGEQYKVLSFTLLVSLVFYFFWVLNNISGWALYFSLLVTVPLFLGVIWFFVGHSTNSKKLSNYTTQVTQYIKNRECPKSCRRIYLLFISLVFLSLSVIPSISIFKDVFSVNLVNYTRINQINYAKVMQQRVLKMDEFSRMFFPLKFDKPNNSGSRFLFPNDKNQDTGIFGFKDDIISIGKSYDCGTDKNKGRNDTSGPAGIFMDYLLKVSLQFAQQHVVSTDKLDNHEGCWKEGDFYFKTEDSAGLVSHRISSDKIKLGKVFNDGISKGAKWRFFILLVTSCAVWVFVLSFFSRKVLGVFISEPIRHHSSLLDIQSDSERNSYKILIRDERDKFLQLLKNRNDSEEGNIEYVDVLTTNFYNLPGILMHKTFVIDNLDAAINDTNRRKRVLAYLEELVFKQHGLAIHVFICCKIAPLHRLINPQAYPYVSEPGIPAPYTDMDEIYRWGKLLASFSTHYCWEPLYDEIYFDNLGGEGLSDHQNDLIKFVRVESQIWPDLGKIREELELLILDGDSQLLNKKQVLEYISTHANAYYRYYWELCTRDERLALYQLATDKYINPANQDVIEHLYQRGYIKREPYFRITNQSFKHFILTAELLENVQDWEKAANESVWESIKVPLFIILFGLTGLVLYIASDAFDITLGLLSGLLAFIPILLKGVNTVKGRGGLDLNSDLNSDI